MLTQAVAYIAHLSVSIDFYLDKHHLIYYSIQSIFFIGNPNNDFHLPIQILSNLSNLFDSVRCSMEEFAYNVQPRGRHNRIPTPLKEIRLIKKILTSWEMRWIGDICSNTFYLPSQFSSKTVFFLLILSTSNYLIDINQRFTITNILR